MISDRGRGTERDRLTGRGGKKVCGDGYGLTDNNLGCDQDVELRTVLVNGEHNGSSQGGSRSPCVRYSGSAKAKHPKMEGSSHSTGTLHDPVPVAWRGVAGASTAGGRSRFGFGAMVHYSDSEISSGTKLGSSDNLHQDTATPALFLIYIAVE